MRPGLRTFAVALVLTSTFGPGCGGGGAGSGQDGGSPDAGPPVIGEPIAGLTAGQWNWVPFPDSSCSDGSPTGIGVNPGGGPDLVFFLDGGGACASAFTCFTLHTATLGPCGEAEFVARQASLPGSVLDRTLSGNPFSDATLVFVPYCTADVHGGDRVVTYAGSPGGTVHHAGHTNVLAYLARLAATYPSPRRLVVTGSSAGGFGTLVNYPAIRRYYPAAESLAVDDSGTPLESNGGPLIQAGFQSWGITDVLDPLCGAGVCEADLSESLSALARHYPGDRFALLSWNVDPVLSAFYGIAQADFTVGLLKMTSDVVDPTANVRAFIAAGQDHTMLEGPGAVSQNGVPLVSWLAEEVAGDGAWTTVRP